MIQDDADSRVLTAKTEVIDQSIYSSINWWNSVKGYEICQRKIEGGYELMRYLSLKLDNRLL